MAGVASRNNPLQVDHIKPRSTYPHLVLVEDNLQALCQSCNKGKSNTDETDWRYRVSNQLRDAILKMGVS